jgi:hypothetical protein
MEIPSGYRFHPYDRELVEFYLLNKVIGKPIPYNPVMDCDLYGDPKIWSKIFEQTGMKTLYFYTQLKKKTKNGKQFDRATQFGTWRCQKDVQVYDSDDKKKRRHIGSHRSFSFKAKRGFDSKGKWTMHEFRLDGIYVNTKNPVSFLLSFFVFTTYVLFLIVCLYISFFLDCLYISLFIYLFFVV